MTSATGRRAGSRASGFTLIELVLVMTAIAILGVMAMPRLSATFAALETERGAQEIAQILRVAQAQAVAATRAVRCWYEPDERRVAIQPVSEPGAAAAPAVPPRRSHPLPAGAEVDIQAPDPAAGVMFYPDGTSSGATIVLTMGDHVYQLQVDPVTSSVTLRAGRPAAR